MAAAWQLVIGRPGGEEQVFPLEDGVYSIGQESNNHIVLNDPTISWRHAVLSVTPTEVAVDDLGSNTGTYLSGHRVTTRTVVPCGERIQLGGFVLRVETPDAAGGSFAASTQAAIPKTSLNPVLAQKKRELSPEQKIRLDIKRQVHAELLDRLDLRRMTAQNIGETGLQRRAAELVDQIMNDVRGRLPAGMDADVLGREVYNEAVKLGPLEDFLADESITEIMVNGHDKIYIERDGNLIRTEITFVDDASVGAIIERIVSPIGRRIDESQPYVDARLQDGSRVNAIIPPLSLDGPSITIRKLRKPRSPLIN